MDELSEESLGKISGGVSGSSDEKQKLYESKLSEILEQDKRPQIAVIGKCPKCGNENRMGGNKVCTSCKIKELRKEIFGEEDQASYSSKYSNI